MRIQNNITAINSHRQYNINNGALGKNMEKLSSGYRVNRAADDAAGLAISEKMRAQIRGLNMASRNAQDGISMVQIAESGMQTIQDVLQRIRELAVQAASDTNEPTIDRPSLQKEVDALILEIDEIADTTEFNTMKLLDGTFVNKIIQAGANAGQETPISINSLSAAKLAVNPTAAKLASDPSSAKFKGEDGLKLIEGLSVKDLMSHLQPDGYTGVLASADRLGPGVLGGLLTQSAAAMSIIVANAAINFISDARADLGAVQNRLEYKIANLNNAAENMAAAESRIRDADMAKMMTEFTKNNILFQASTAMLAQANALPQGVLQLLG